MFLKSPLLSFIFLFCASALAATATAFSQLGRTQSKREFKKLRGLFYFQYLLKPFFGKKKWEGLFFALSTTKHFLNLCYASSFFIFLLFTPPMQRALTNSAAT